MFGATADRSRCLQNGEKSRCTFRTNVQCLGSFREYHADADSNTFKLFLFTPPPPPHTELQNIVGNIKNKMLRTGHYLSSVEGGGVGRRILIPKWPPPPSKSSDPFLPPLPTPRRSMVTNRTLLKNKIKKIGKKRRRLYSKAYQQKHLSSSTG